MVIDMGTVGGLLTIGGSMAGGMVWICKSMFVQIKEMLEKLIQSIDKLEKSIDAERNSRHTLELKVQEIEDRSKSLQHRVDKLEGVSR